MLKQLLECTLCRLILNAIYRVGNKYFVAIMGRLYTAAISREFSRFGKGSFVEYSIELRGGSSISIGDNSGLGKRGILAAWEMYRDQRFNPIITIGNFVWIGEDFHITAINGIEIDDDVLIGKKVTISDNSHGCSDFDSAQIPPLARPLYSKGKVCIGKKVWIGDKVTILAGVTIGRNSIIGANSVVTKDIPDNCIAGGAPAKVIEQLTRIDNKE